MVELSKANAFDYIRFVFSTLLLLFAMVVTFYAIIEQKTLFWDIVPGWAALILFLANLFLLGIVEGLQIALVELKRQHPDSYRKSHPLAYRLGQVASKGDNVERFLMGRQVCVVFLVFFCAKLTTIHLEEGENFLFPTPAWFRMVFLETGILACIVVVIIAQLMPQIVAAKYPVHFLQICIMRPAYYGCVFLEMTGLTHACWLLSAGLGRMLGMSEDEFDSIAEDAIAKVNNSLDSVTIETQSSDLANGEDSTSGEKTKKPSVCRIGQYTYLINQLSLQLDDNKLSVIRHFLDSHPEKFAQFPTVIGSKMYPAPQAIAEELRASGHEVPRFLSDISDPEHVPPHIVACELIARNRDLEEEIEMLKQKLNSA